MSTTTVLEPPATTLPTVPISTLDVLTLAQAAAYLQLPESLIRAEAMCQRIPGRAVAEDWRFVREDLLNWVRTRNVVPSVVREETPEEQEAFLEHLREIRQSWGTVGESEATA